MDSEEDSDEEEDIDEDNEGFFRGEQLPEETIEEDSSGEFNDENLDVLDSLYDGERTEDDFEIGEEEDGVEP